MKVLNKTQNDGSIAMQSIHNRARNRENSRQLPVLNICPGLAIRDDADTAAAYPRTDHICTLARGRYIDLGWQERYCTVDHYEACPIYNGLPETSRRSASAERNRDRRIILGFASSVAIVFVALGMVFSTMLDAEHLVADPNTRTASANSADGQRESDGGVAYLSSDAAYDPPAAPRTRYAVIEEIGVAPEAIGTDGTLAVGGAPAEEQQESSTSDSGEISQETGTETAQQNAPEHENASPDEVDTAPAETQFVDTYTVQPGDTLWTITEQFGLDSDTVMALNDLDDPDLIYPGDVLQLN